MPLNLLSRLRRLFSAALSALLLTSGVTTATAVAQQATATKFVDCSLLVAPEYPVTWPTHPFPRFQLIHEQTTAALGDRPKPVDSLCRAADASAWRCDGC